MKYIFPLLLILTLSKAYAQDPILSQSFVHPIVLNSGFNGASQNTSTGIIHRSQWYDLNFNIDTQYAYFSTYISALNSGFGINIIKQSENKNNYNFTQANLSYTLILRLSEAWYFRPSVIVGFGMKDYGFQNILFEDQINLYSQVISKSTDPVALKENKLFLDVSASMLFNNRYSWIGLTLKHLNKPNISLTEYGNSTMDLFLSLHGEFKLPLDTVFPYYFTESNSIYFLSNFMKQGEFSRLDLGFKYVFDDTYAIGIIAETDPLKSTNTGSSINSIDLFTGLKWDAFKFGFSYDFNINNIGYTGGIYEFSLSYDFFARSQRPACIDYF